MLWLCEHGRTAHSSRQSPLANDHGQQSPYIQSRWSASKAHVVALYMLCGDIHTTSFLSHPSIKYLKLPAFRGAVLAKRAFILLALGALWSVRIVHLAIDCPRLRCYSGTVPLPAAQVELPKDAGRPGECPSFFLHCHCVRAVPGATPGRAAEGAFRGRTRCASQAPTQPYATADNGVFVSLEAGPRMAAIALLGYDAPGKRETKKVTSLVGPLPRHYCWSIW